MWHLQVIGAVFSVIIVALSLFTTAYVVTRLFIVLSDIYKKRKTAKWNSKRRKGGVKTMIIAGSGGHTSEILRLVASLGDVYSPRQYVVADSDKMSIERIRRFEQDRGKDNNSEYNIAKVPRSREVKQSWLTTIPTTIYATVCSLPLVYSSKPDLILCNGPGTCIPLCGAGFLLTLFGIKKVMIVYAESICRVTTMSLSGKILYHFADQVIVQWPELQKDYPQTRYLGKIV